MEPLIPLILILHKYTSNFFLAQFLDVFLAELLAQFLVKLADRPRTDGPTRLLSLCWMYVADSGLRHAGSELDADTLLSNHQRSLRHLTSTGKPHYS